jgi:acetoin utilization deacetylase AcuC-like enzyme
VNLPLPPGTSGEVYREIVDELIEPLADEFKPEIIAVSAGQDAYFADPIADLNFSADAYFHMTKLVMQIADRHCSGRLVMALEGGYNLEALPKIIAGIIVAQSGSDIKIFEPTPPSKHGESRLIKERIMQAKAALNAYWKAFR